MSHRGLEQLQGAFRDYLFTGANEAQLARSISGREFIAAELRLDVYRNAYFMRLQDALTHDFPALRRVLGDVACGHEMVGYLAQYPSTSPSLRNIGVSLAQYFLHTDRPHLAELCRLEWAVLHAFDAADAVVPTSETLQAIPPEDWQNLRFSLHPSVSLVQVTSNALAVWVAYRKAWASIPPLEAAEARAIIVWRHAGVPAAYPLSSNQGAFLAGLAQGLVFSSVCERLQSMMDTGPIPQIVSRCLVEAVKNGWITHTEGHT